jgi:hypothetical protein
LALSYGVFAEAIEETKNSYEFVSRHWQNSWRRTYQRRNLVVVIAGNYGSNSGLLYRNQPVEILLTAMKSIATEIEGEFL